MILWDNACETPLSCFGLRRPERISKVGTASGRLCTGGEHCWSMLCCPNKCQHTWVGGTPTNLARGYVFLHSWDLCWVAPGDLGLVDGTRVNMASCKRKRKAHLPKIQKLFDQLLEQNRKRDIVILCLHGVLFGETIKVFE